MSDAGQKATAPTGRVEEASVPVGRVEDVRPAASGAEAWRGYSSVFTNAKAGMEGVDKDRVKQASVQGGRDLVFLF